jgi:hypothetical protein
MKKKINKYIFNILLYYVTFIVKDLISFKNFINIHTHEHIYYVNISSIIVVEFSIKY